MQTFSASQNDRVHLIFVKDINISFSRFSRSSSYFDWLKNYNLKLKFLIFSPVANLMHHPLQKPKPVVVETVLVIFV